MQKRPLFELRWLQATGVCQSLASDYTWRGTKSGHILR